MRFCGGSDRNTGAGRVVGRSEPGGRGKWFWWATFPVPLAHCGKKEDRDEEKSLGIDRRSEESNEGRDTRLFSG